MCLTVPGKVLSIDAADGEVRLARVDFGGTVRAVNLLYAPEATVGSYVIVHAGFATAVIPESEALEALEYVRQWSEWSSSSAPGATGEARAD